MLTRTDLFASLPRLALGFAAALVVADDVAASGVGASYYVSGPVAAPGQPPCEVVVGAPCDGCERPGFACVDPETPPPCTADGGCYPARLTFGHYQTKWRPWPVELCGADAPALAPPEGEDSLLPSFDPPPAEQEDQRAPPPIEETDPADESAPGGIEAGPGDAPLPPPPARPIGPGIDIKLPPLPEGGLQPPAAQPAAPAPPTLRDTPPALPFGFTPPRERTSPAALPAPPKGPELEGRRWRAPVPPFGQARRPEIGTSVSRDILAAGAAPPLPEGLSRRSDDAPLRRLPVAAGDTPVFRYDVRVRPASALQRLPPAE